MKPLLTLAELKILLDATQGSLSIHDNGLLFKWEKETRQQVVQNIMTRMLEVELSVDDSQIVKAN